MLGPLAGEGGKVAFQCLHRLGVRGDGVVDVRPLAEVVEDLLQTFKAEPLNQELHDQRRFVVGELHVQVAFGREERGAQFADRRQVIAQNHFAITRVHRLAPARIGLRFLVNGNALTEPTRHFVPSQPQRDHVTELVPEHRFPIGGVRRLGRRTVRGDDAPEANAEKTRIVRDAECANGKILLFGKNFNDGRLVQLPAVFLQQEGPGALQQIQHAVAVHRRFAPAHAEDKITVGDGLEFRQRLAQRDQVVGGHIVAVPLMHLFGQ